MIVVTCHSVMECCTDINAVGVAAKTCGRL